jgi:hypothetical protein
LFKDGLTVSRFKEVKSLTPSEALHLLAEGFVLEFHDCQFKVNLETGSMLFKGNDFDWKVTQFKIYRGMTIHELPNG